MIDALQTFLILGRKEKKITNLTHLSAVHVRGLREEGAGKKKKEKRETHTRRHDARMRVTEGEAEEKDRRMES